MCTVTILRTESGIRMACNRDESRARPAALLPRVVTVGQRRALMPIDPQSGGTWIAATDAGLVFTLLNAYSAPRDPQAPTPRVSRGTIIPRLLDADTLAEACERVQALRAEEYAGFRLVMADRESFAEFYCSGVSCRSQPPTPLVSPMLFTSSGLGDGLVEPPRRAVFEEWFAVGVDGIARQDAFHRHSWPDRPHLSVCMRRPDARTVSFTVVELDADGVQMIYHPEAPDQPASAFGVRLGPREQ